MRVPGLQAAAVLGNRVVGAEDLHAVEKGIEELLGPRLSPVPEGMSEDKGGFAVARPNRLEGGCARNGSRRAIDQEITDIGRRDLLPGQNEKIIWHPGRPPDLPKFIVRPEVVVIGEDQPL
jgi:hypothetical protein